MDISKCFGEERMYRIPAVLDNPATFCQIQQFPESGNKSLAKTAQKHDQKVAKI